MYGNRCASSYSRIATESSDGAWYTTHVTITETPNKQATVAISSMPIRVGCAMFFNDHRNSLGASNVCGTLEVISSAGLFREVHLVPSAHSIGVHGTLGTPMLHCCC